MPAKYELKIDGDIADVLRNATVLGNKLTLPPGQLDRTLYTAIDKVLKAAGGKWNRGAKAHVFADEAGIAKFMGALKGGFIVDAKKAMQQFFTPADLADYVVRQADIEPGMTVLEPSAGQGALAIVAAAHGGKVTCVEKDVELAAALLNAHGYMSIYPEDFMLWTPELRFDRVVMNPPFTGQQDVEHITRAFSFLRSGGKLVSVAGAGIKSNSRKDVREFRALVESVGGSIESLPEGSFKESGTGVNTVLVVMEKP